MIAVTLDIYKPNGLVTVYKNMNHIRVMTSVYIYEILKYIKGCFESYSFHEGSRLCSFTVRYNTIKKQHSSRYAYSSRFICFI